MRDKKFERIVGIDSRILEENISEEEIFKRHDMAEKELIADTDSFLNKFGESYKGLCEIVRNPDNYRYDCRAAVFMLLGIKYAPLHELWKDYKKWPFGKRKKDSAIQTTTWCGEFQSVLSLRKFEEILDLEVGENGRLGRFAYHNLLDIQDSLDKQIEKECNREDKLFEKYDKLDNLQKKELASRVSTRNRKENWILADIFLGRSYSLTLYYGIMMFPKEERFDFDVLLELIQLFSLLKCFQLRNVIANEVFQILFLENNLSEENISQIINNVKKILKIANKYYKNILTLEWYRVSRDEQLKDRHNLLYFMDCEAEGLGTYIESDKSGLHLIEKNLGKIEEVYKKKLEGDLKNLYDANYDYRCDRDFFLMGEDFPVKINGSQTLDEKKTDILGIEYNRIKNSEKNMKITNGRKKIISNASALFTYIHWKVMEMSEISDL